jgi:hypothetical protein
LVVQRLYKARVGGFVSGNAHHRITHSKSGGQHMRHIFIPVQIRNILRPVISIIKRYLENNLLSPKPPFPVANNKEIYETNFRQPAMAMIS